MNQKMTSHAMLLSTIALGFGCNAPQPKETAPVSDKIPFKGVMKLDVRESTPDWEPFMLKKAPEGSPNILFILYDDTGLAAWSPYGGAINMPTLDKLAANGLTYTQWHTVHFARPPVPASLPDATIILTVLEVLRKARTGFPASMPDFPRSVPRSGRYCRIMAGAPSGLARTIMCPYLTSLQGQAKGNGPCKRVSTAFTGLSEEKQTSGTPTWLKTIVTLSNLMALKMAIIFQKTWPTRPSR